MTLDVLQKALVFLLRPPLIVNCILCNILNFCWRMNKLELSFWFSSRNFFNNVVFY